MNSQAQHAASWKRQRLAAKPNLMGYFKTIWKMSPCGSWEANHELLENNPSLENLGALLWSASEGFSTQDFSFCLNLLALWHYPWLCLRSDYLRKLKMRLMMVMIHHFSSKQQMSTRLEKNWRLSTMLVEHKNSPAILENNCFLKPITRVPTWRDGPAFIFLLSPFTPIEH